MITGPIIAEVAALVGDPARATMVAALLDGRTLAASDLARAAHVTPQTASAHLAKLTEAATAGKADQALTYLRELLTARALLANGRAAEAVEAFKRAAAIAPGASSARVGLVSALVILGERAEAEQLTEALQTGKATVVDPWWIYWQGDYRRYPETLRSMRELVR